MMTSNAPYMGMVIHVTLWGKEHTDTELDPHCWHSFNDRVKPGDKRDVCDVRVTSRPFFYKSNSTSMTRLSNTNPYCFTRGIT